MLLRQILRKESQRRPQRTKVLRNERRLIAAEALLYSRVQEGLEAPHFLPSHFARNVVL